MHRRQFLASAAGLSAAAGSGCLSSSTPPGEFRGQELRVFVYAGAHEETMRAAFVPYFEAATGATVTLLPGWWDAIPKLKAAPPDDPPYDLLITDATQGYPAAKGGLFQQLDLDNIPNHKRIVASALDNKIVKDRYGVTYPDSVHTMALDQRQIGFPPQRWGELFRGDLKGKLGLYNSFYMSLYTFACAMADTVRKSGTAHDLIAKNLEGVLRFAREHRDWVKVWWPTTTDMILALSNKDCAAGNMHSPEYIQAMREKTNLAAAVPPANRAFVQVFWAIPAGAKKKALAEKAIDAIFADDMQLAFARRGSATAIPEVAAKMAAADTVWRDLYPHTPAQFASLRYYPYEVYAEHWDHIADAWDRTVLRKG